MPFFLMLFLLVINAFGVTKNNFTSQYSFQNLSAVILIQNQLQKTTNNTMDTLAMINNHLKLADENKNKGSYSLSYDHLWDALLLANASNNYLKLSSIHDELGLLYSIYIKEEKAIKHKKLSLFYAKQTDKSSHNYEGNLTRAYYGLAIQYRKAKQYDKSLIYLDSCLFIKKNISSGMNNPYVYAEKANIFLITNQLEKSEKILLKVAKSFEADKKSFLVVVYSFLGDLYYKKNDLEKAESYYKESLEIMAIFESHTDLKADILKKISELYKRKGHISDAYFYLNESIKVSDSLFSIRSKNNNELFEIKDRYKEAIAKKDAYINKQESIIKTKNLVQSRLIISIAFILFTVVILLIVYYQLNKMRKLKVEKENIELKTKNDKEKLNIILETKSKELTVSALQLIEKDKKVDKLLDILKDEAPGNIYKKVKKEVTRGNNDMWERFNVRFTEVNTDFYNRLREKHKTLTPTEQKHCALIKLNFDSKEMAGLLSISINSVHISRHRIRKKMGLKRDESLSNYIANI